MSGYSQDLLRRSNFSSGFSVSRGAISRSEGIMILVEQITNKVPKKSCGKKCTRSMKTLLIAFMLFTTITSAQVTGGIIAHSLTLLGDCTNMALDSINYLVYMFAECYAPSQNKNRNILIASGISLVVMFGATGTIIYIATGTIIPRFKGQIKEEKKYVNPWIVFGFAVTGFLFDAIALFMVGQNQNSESSQLHTIHYEGEIGEIRSNDKKKNNLLITLMHIVSDLMRSITTLILAFMLWFTNFHNVFIDAMAALIMASLVFFGGFGILIGWIKSVITFCQVKKENQKAFLEAPSEMW